MNQKKALLPISIITIGIIIAGGIIFARQEPSIPEPKTDSSSDNIIDIKPITNEDHILGNPNADVLIVEYSDFECPYCKAFHSTMDAIMGVYAKTGKVAWVYRHLPATEYHQYAYGAAMASECVNEQTDKFWHFSRAVFESAPESLTPENLKTTALELGVNEEEYDLCISEERYKEKIEGDLNDAKKIAEKVDDFGTPYNIVISRSGLQTQINGSESYENMVELIDILLNE